jgi:hypothetical protein
MSFFYYQLPLAESGIVARGRSDSERIQSDHQRRGRILLIVSFAWARSVRRYYRYKPQFHYRELQNDEIITTITEDYQCELRNDNIISLLGRVDADCSREIEFAVSHFHGLDESSIHEMSSATLLKIFQSKSLKIKNEDWLYAVISDLIHRDQNAFSLIECVQFLATDVASRFIELACQFINLLNLSIFVSLGRRFVLPVSTNTINGRSEMGRVIELKPDSPPDGIIAYLTLKCSGNVHDRGIVDVAASGNNDNLPKNVVDFQNRSTYVQTDSKESHPYFVTISRTDKSHQLPTHSCHTPMVQIPTTRNHGIACPLILYPNMLATV